MPIGMYDRASGKVIAEVMPDGKGETLRDWVLKHTEPGCIFLTDGDPRYKPLARVDRENYFVNHKQIRILCGGYPKSLTEFVERCSGIVPG